MSRLEQLIGLMSFEIPPIDQQMSAKINKPFGYGMNHAKTNQGILFDDDHTIHLMASEDFGLIIDGKQKQIHWIGSKKQEQGIPKLYQWNESWRSNYGKL